jgi:hypothetical protein
VTVLFLSEYKYRSTHEYDRVYVLLYVCRICGGHFIIVMASLYVISLICKNKFLPAIGNVSLYSSDTLRRVYWIRMNKPTSQLLCTTIWSYLFNRYGSNYMFRLKLAIIKPVSDISNFQYTEYSIFRCGFWSK